MALSKSGGDAHEGHKSMYSEGIDNKRRLQVSAKSIFSILQGNASSIYGLQPSRNTLQRKRVPNETPTRKSPTN